MNFCIYKVVQKSWNRPDRCPLALAAQALKFTIFRVVFLLFKNIKMCVGVALQSP